LGGFQHSAGTESPTIRTRSCFWCSETVSEMYHAPHEIGISQLSNPLPTLYLDRCQAMERRSVMILIAALLLAGATAATAYSRSMSPQQASTGSYVGTTTGVGHGGGNGMMGGGMVGGMMGGSYVGQQASATANGSSNSIARWSWQGMWSWCRGMMSDFGGRLYNQTSSQLP